MEATDTSDPLNAIQRVAKRSDALNALQKSTGVSAESVFDYGGRMGKCFATFGRELVGGLSS